MNTEIVKSLLGELRLFTAAEDLEGVPQAHKEDSYENLTYGKAA